MQIPIAKPAFTEEDLVSVRSPLESGWIVQGPLVKKFEEEWSQYTGAKHSIAVTSCTTALHLSLSALGFGAGDEAIVPAFTWVSTANVIEHLGGSVVFCDIDLQTFNLDAFQLESKITENTKAILPVHLFGLAADMTPIMEIARLNRLWVVEDAACGFGSRYHQKHVGTFGNTGCFSFHPRKSITTGEGGMITTSDDELAEKMRSMRDHGAALSDRQRHLGPKPYLLSDHPYAGYNYRMTDLQAALGVSQMYRAEKILLERQKLAETYNQSLLELQWLQTPTQRDDLQHGYQSYPCVFQPEMINSRNIKQINQTRNRLMDYLQSKGISTRPATHAVHLLSYYKEKYSLKSVDYPNAFAADHCSLSLPLYNGMTKEEQSHVIETLHSITIEDF
ncbi:aminotransferase DegT [Candidatus Poribacteria bacterium]|nr:aminotransferase DegT [Candidatus Poribacteria bacterium]